MNRRQFVTLPLPTALAAVDSRPAVPDFHARTLAKESFTRAGLKGKVVLIQFWATWCGFCRKDQAELDDVYMDLSAKGLQVLAVNVGEPAAKVNAYLRNSERMVPVVLSADTDLLQVFPTKAFPTYIVISREGKLAATSAGAMGYDGFLRLLKAAGL